jgi:RNA polymerase sigma factor (sigma-70 family)
MRYSKRLELFEKLKDQYSAYLASILWKLTGDSEIFAEAFQYSMLGIWMNLEKLTGSQASPEQSRRAGAYIYRIALSANSKAWQNRVGKNGQLPVTKLQADVTIDEEALSFVRKEIAKLPEKQSQAIVMRYIEQNDYAVIAEKLDCTQDTARSHVSKALNTLRNSLGYLNISES